MTKNTREGRRQLPLENVCVFVAGKKQPSDPRNDLKRQIGMVQAKAYYTDRGKRKGGMDAAVFDIVSWETVKSALKGTGNMFTM